MKVGNDANVAALGEMWAGGGKGAENLIMATLGTGVGGGIIVDGKIVTGAHGAGGEIGHAILEPGEAEPCNCGNHGCLEQMASATGIARLAGRRLAADSTPSALRGERVTAKAVFDAYKDGDSVAAEIVEQFADYLGRAIDVYKRQDDNPERDMAVVQGIIELVHKFHIRIVAEGVESPGQVEYLRKAGCDYVQGYVFYRPMPQEDYEKLIAERSPGV